MNEKNIKDKITRKINRKSVKAFLKKQGLYVLIFLCVAAAGITAIIAWPRSDSNQPQIGENDPASVVGDTSLEEEMAMQTPMPSPSPSATTTPAPSESPTTTETSKPNNNGSGSIKLRKPVDGQIINSFSGDELVFFPSLNAWATHNGTDIQAEEGTPVCAAMAGTVSEAYTNEADGGVVVIKHSDSIETVYAGLGDLLVSEGDKVNAGDIIGTVGEIPKEMDLPSHLHFEYKVNGEWKDPAKFF